MADRRSLLDTGKDIGSSVAGTLKSAAGTLADTGRETASRTRSLAGTLASRGRDVATSGTRRAMRGVREEFEDLTDETVTDQEQARLERARQEALQEAQQEARQEFQEEFRENIFDEAFAAELEELQRRNPQVQRTTTNRGNRKKKLKREALDTETQTESTERTRRAPAPGGGLALFGPPPAQRQAQAPQQQAQSQPTMGLFGVPQRPPAEPPAASAPTGTENLFGVNSLGQNQEVQQDPLFGLRF